MGRRHRQPGTRGHDFWVEGLEPICAGLISGAALVGIGNAIVKLAHELGMALPAAALTMQGINALIGRGEGRKDLSALIRIVEDLNGGRAA